MIKEEVPIRVGEGNDPLLRLRVTVIDRTTQPATRTPYNFTNAQAIEFVIKEGVSTPDTDALARYTVAGGAVAVVGPPTDGRVDVQVTGADVPGAGNRRYRLDVVKNNKRETVMAGPFIVQDL